ncbi:MAG: hypothetical protein Q7R94_01655 [bacterium]|nr:hypothetical protein [bacterium]
MNEEELPPFTVVAIVCMLLITIPSDITTAVTLFNFIVAIPYVGAVILAMDKVLSVIAWAVVQFWFVMALGTFGKSGLVVLVGGVLDVLGVPGTTITAMIAVWLANHPTAGGAARVLAEKAAAKAAMAKGAKGTPGAVKGGGPAAQPKAVGASVQTVRETAPGEVAPRTAAEPGGAEAKVGARPSEIETGVKPSEVSAAPPREGGEQEKPVVSEERLGALPGPFEQAQEEVGLTGKLPQPEKKKEGSPPNEKNKAA